jgi:hypothetical protein
LWRETIILIEQVHMTGPGTQHHHPGARGNPLRRKMPTFNSTNTSFWDVWVTDVTEERTASTFRAEEYAKLATRSNQTYF